MNILFNLLEQEWFVNALAVVAIAISAGLSTLIGLWFKKLADKVEANTKDEKYTRVLNTVNQLIQDSVLAVQQTFVSQLKKDGKFDPENQKIAFNKAFETILANLTVEAEAILTEIYGDFKKWIAIQIEMIVATMLPHGRGK